MTNHRNSVKTLHVQWDSEHAEAAKRLTFASMAAEATPRKKPGRKPGKDYHRASSEKAERISKPQEQQQRGKPGPKPKKLKVKAEAEMPTEPKVNKCGAFLFFPPRCVLLMRDCSECRRTIVDPGFVCRQGVRQKLNVQGACKMPRCLLAWIKPAGQPCLSQRIQEAALCHGDLTVVRQHLNPNNCS